MRRLSARLAAVALALPLAAVALSGPAAALEPVSTTVPGCYGAGPAVVCEPTVTVETPQPVFGTEAVSVCAGPCHDVPVTTVATEPGSRTRVCVSYTDRAGTPFGGCVHEDVFSESFDLSRYVNCAMLGLCV